MERAAKAEQVTELKEVFKTANTVVVAHYAGLTVAQMQVLRKQARQAGTTVKVAKNRLAKIALDGTDVADVRREAIVRGQAQAEMREEDPGVEHDDVGKLGVRVETLTSQLDAAIRALLARMGRAE